MNTIFFSGCSKATFTFAVISSRFFSSFKDIEPHFFCFVQIFFPSMEKYTALTSLLHSFAIALPVLLFAWPSASFEQSL